MEQIVEKNANAAMLKMLEELVAEAKKGGLTPRNFNRTESMDVNSTGTNVSITLNFNKG